MAKHSYTNPEFIEWLSSRVTFANTMVDRIVPENDPNDLVTVKSVVKEAHDDCVVVGCEPYFEWVVEIDKEQVPEPMIDSPSVTITREILPYENRKLKILNASHSAMALIGLLLGMHYIYEVMENASAITFVLQMMVKEVIPHISEFEETELRKYLVACLERFKDPSTKYTCEKVATDGSQKLRERVLPSIYAQAQRENPSHYLSLVIACWIQYWFSKQDKKTVSDPLRQKLIERSQSQGKNLEWLTREFLNLLDPNLLGLDPDKLFKPILMWLNQLQGTCFKILLVEQFPLSNVQDSSYRFAVRLFTHQHNTVAHQLESDEVYKTVSQLARPE